MRFAFTPEQDELRRSVRRFCDDRSPLTEVRRLMETTEGFDPDVWKQLTTELGATALAIPEAYGGHGFGFVELTCVFEETGRALLCAPFFSTAVATNAILNAGTEEQKRELLPAIAAGERTAALAFVEPGAGWDVDDVSMPSLDGTKTFVVDGHTANTIVVALRDAGGITLALVDGDTDGLTRQPLNVLDATRKQAELRFDGVEVTPLGERGSAEAALRKTLDQAAACLAAEMVGGIQGCLDMAVGFAKERVQFGRPIGAFQAVKHMCADMLLDLESARSAAYYAAWAAATDSPDLPVAASLAKAFCAEAYFRCAQRNHQIHGGIGFTWEHDCHLYYRRTKTSELMLGDPTYHRDRIGRLLGV